MSNDSGASWRDINSTWTYHKTVRGFIVVGSNLLAAVDSGICMRPLSEIVAAAPKIGGDTPKSFSLAQNYPNPFNPATEIRFTLSTTNHTTLTIYDLLGREVATLISATLRPGTHSARWDASGFRSGIYLCRLTSGHYTSTRKLLLLK